MRLKHYLLIALTVLLIAFFQPFVVFLGNLIVIGAALAYVYSDLSPEAQDAYEQKLANFLHGIRGSLRGRGEARNKARMEKRSGIFRLLRRKQVTPTTNTPLVIEDAIEAEFDMPAQSSPKQTSDSSPKADETLAQGNDSDSSSSQKAG